MKKLTHITSPLTSLVLCMVLTMFCSLIYAKEPEVPSYSKEVVELTSQSKTEVAKFVEVLSRKLSTGEGDAAKKKRAKEVSEKQAAIETLAKSPLLPHVLPQLLKVALDNDIDSELRKSAAEIIENASREYKLSESMSEQLQSILLKACDRGLDHNDWVFRYSKYLHSSVSNLAKQPSLKPVLAKDWDVSFAKILVKYNSEIDGMTRNARSEVNKINNSTSKADYTKVYQSLSELGRHVGNKFISKENNDALCDLYCAILVKKGFAVYHYSDPCGFLGKLGNPKAVPVLEKFIKDHPSESVNPYVGKYVLGIAKKSIQEIQENKQ